MAQIRLDDSIDQLDGLRNEILNWVSDTRRHDTGGRHGDHLRAIEEVTRAALTGIRDWLPGHVAGRSQGEVYAECRRADLRIVRVRRFWRWYADRLDQYTWATRTATLTAADEIVRSSWAGVFPESGDGTEPPPAPLVAMADLDVPTAVARSEVPPDLKAPADELVATWTARMPISTITLPVTVLTRPWWLILAVHEAGHQVHAEIFRSTGAVDALVVAAEEAARRAGAGADDTRSWARWAAESFADAVAVVLAGSAPIRAVAELELSDDEALLASGPRTGRYPPPLVRWILADTVAAGLGIDDPVTGTRAGLLDGRPHTRELIRQGSAVTGALLDLPLGRTSLRRIGAGTSRRQKAALTWRDAFLARSGPLPRHAPESARLCAAGGTLAWFALAGSTGGTTPDRFATLSRRMLDLVPRCGPVQVRSAAPSTMAKGITRTAELIVADLRSDNW